jgi:hypothetical protein
MYTHPEITSSWEELAVLVETDGHHSVSGIEGFFYTVPVVHVDVDIKHSWVVSANHL